MKAPIVDKTGSVVGGMADKRHMRRHLVDQANKLRDKNYQLRPRQWQQAIFTLRQHGELVR